MAGPYEGDSTSTVPAGLTGRNTSSNGNGIGVLATSATGEGVHAETNSTAFAAVAGIELNASSNVAAVYGEQRGNGPGVFGTAKGNGAGVFGTSANGEGVHGETDSTAVAAVAGIELNTSSNAAAVYGEQRGGGPGVFGIAKGNGAGVFGTSAGYEGVHGETSAANGSAAIGAINKGNGAAFFGISQQGEGVHGETSSDTFAGVGGINKGPAAQGKNPCGVFGSSQNGEGVHGETSSNTFAAVAGVMLNPSGTGAGVYGESRGQGPAGFFKGNVMVTGDILLLNADCAEDFEVALPEDSAPGTVMALDTEGRLRPTSNAYDKKVVGIVSGAGGYKPGIILDRTCSNAHRLPVALLGKVYTKVDADFGPIEAGDLLTSSPMTGHAMKASDQARAFGAVIGKALASLACGQGLIPVLIALQ